MYYKYFYFYRYIRTLKRNLSAYKVFPSHHLRAHSPGSEQGVGVCRPLCWVTGQCLASHAMPGCSTGSVARGWGFTSLTRASLPICWLLPAALLESIRSQKVSACCKIVVKIQWCCVFYVFVYFVLERISRLLSGLLSCEIMEKTVAKMFGAGVLLYTKYLLRLTTYGAVSEE